MRRRPSCSPSLRTNGRRTSSPGGLAKTRGKTRRGQMTTRDAFHKELREIEEAVIQMATLVEDAIAKAMRALVRLDSVLAEEVAAGDAAVNELQRDIRNRCISVMARQAPV